MVDGLALSSTELTKGMRARMIRLSSLFKAMEMSGCNSNESRWKGLGASIHSSTDVFVRDAGYSNTEIRQPSTSQSVLITIAGRAARGVDDERTVIYVRQHSDHNKNMEDTAMRRSNVAIPSMTTISRRSDCGKKRMKRQVAIELVLLFTFIWNIARDLSLTQSYMTILFGQNKAYLWYETVRMRSSFILLKVHYVIVRTVC